MIKRVIIIIIVVIVNLAGIVIVVFIGDRISRSYLRDPHNELLQYRLHYGAENCRALRRQADALRVRQIVEVEALDVG